MTAQRTSLLSASILSAVLSVVAYSAASASEVFEYLEFRPGATLGVGWNSLENDIATRRATCIEMSDKNKRNTLLSGYADLIEECSVRHYDLGSGWHLPDLSPGRAG